MKVAVLMGSKTDWPVMEKAVKALKAMKIDVEAHVLSAHRCPIGLAQYVENSDVDIFIAGAGMAAHLAGMVAARTERPVIGVPLSNTLHGQDALLSTVQMPAGCPVATMAIDGAENAAVIAAQIIALTDEGVFDRLVDYKQARYMRSLKDDEEIQELVKAM